MLDLTRHSKLQHSKRGRPLIAAYEDVVPPSASEDLARDVALRFVRVQRVWGPWGLAWWEAVFRAVDAIASAEPPGTASPDVEPAAENA